MRPHTRKKEYSKKTMERVSIVAQFSLGFSVEKYALSFMRAVFLSVRLWLLRVFPIVLEMLFQHLDMSNEESRCKIGTERGTQTCEQPIKKQLQIFVHVIDSFSLCLAFCERQYSLTSSGLWPPRGRPGFRGFSDSPQQFI